jgi:glycosyltransferase involved in cell wall biosynthesis
MRNKAITVILHDNQEAKEAFYRTMESIQAQTSPVQEVIVLGASRLNGTKNLPRQVHYIEERRSLGASLNQAIEDSSSPFILYIDNRQEEVLLKKATCDLFLLLAHQEENWGMCYADYEIYSDQNSQEVHLLKHHRGRVRDNQDYGKVFFFNREALTGIGKANPEWKYNTLYDLRLKISEKYRLIHVANRYAGSLYSLRSEGSEHNVFDYLMASKESQVEAEKVLQGHLRRIGANLEAGQHYQVRASAPEGTTLRASIIIPVNNRPQFTAMAIESVQAQTVQDIEIIIVVNGGEKDPTIAAVQRYLPGGACYDDQKPEVSLLVYDINNLGLCLNMGAWSARGEYYVQLDSDDRLKKDAVEKILEVFAEDQSIGMVIGSYEVWEKEKNGDLRRMEKMPVVTHDEWTEENGRNNLLRINGAGAPRAIPIQLIRDIGFSVNQEPYARNYGEDYGMVLKISEKHRIGRVWDPIYEVIRHEGGTDHSIDQATIDRNDEAKDFMRKEAIERRILLNQKVIKA